MQIHKMGSLMKLEKHWFSTAWKLHQRNHLKVTFRTASQLNYFKTRTGILPGNTSLFCAPLFLNDDRFGYFKDFQQNASNSSYSNKSTNYFKKSSVIALTGVGISSAIAFYTYFHVVRAEETAQNKHVKSVNTVVISPGDEIPDLPTYTADEVSSHDSKDKRIWVCYRSGVYDITNFVDKHPGGNKIMMAAGGSLEPFWELFAIHKTDRVSNMLEKFRVGNLRIEDRNQEKETTTDPFSKDPIRHPVLEIRSAKPFNAEPPTVLLTESFITPNELFFVRNHLPVPEVDPKEYELEISGIGIQPINLSLQDLKTKFPKHTIAATLQCAGNRRSELNKVKEVKGLNWESGAISTASWSGARLDDVLTYAGVNFKDSSIKHIQFEGLDVDPASMPYGASIPAKKAFDPEGDVLLAYEMNGQELPRDHGYPVRVVAPGIVGARNVKWLSKIVVSDEESNSHWQKGDYKSFSPNTTWETVNFDSAPAIQDMPVNSVICHPQDASRVDVSNGYLKVVGYAWSGGGRKIIRVDVSADDGKTWTTATLKNNTAPLHRCWTWTLWEVDVPVSRSNNSFQIACKAVDASYNAQPETFPPIWNLRGVLGNAWHRVQVTSK